MKWDRVEIVWFRKISKCEGVCIEGRFPKIMNEKGEDDPILHIMEKIRDVAN